MMKRTAAGVWLLAPVLVFGAEAGGVPPRVDRTQYAVAMFNQSLAVAAERVPAAKVRKEFGPEVDGRYLVVEVGVFPKAKDPLEVRPGNFTLRVNRTRDTISPSGAKSLVDLSENAKPVAVQLMAALVAELMAKLMAKCLPETSTDKPVAGYLYFFVPDKKDGDNEYELEYKAQRNWMILPLRAGTPR